MRRAKWIALIGAASLVALAFAILRRHPHAPPPRSELTPDLALVTYRYAATPASNADLDGMIAQLEARAKESYASALDMTDLAELYYRRALQDGNSEDYQRSEALARRSREQMPFRNGAPVTLAKIAAAQHRFREAITMAREHLVHRQTAVAYVVIATAHMALGELAQAAEAADAAIKHTPSSSTYLTRALVLQARGDDPAAAADFARAATVEEGGDPQGAAKLRTLWGRFLLRRGELGGAKVLFDEALRIVPEFPFARAQHAELALRGGRYKEARAMYEQAFASSRQVRYLIDLARAQQLGGDPAAADSTRAQAEKLVRGELSSYGLGHQLDLVEILVDRGRPADLVEAVSLAREEVGRRASADTRFQLARALARAGARDEALAQIRGALATGARDARMFELASRLESGAPAASYAREADELDPGDSGWRKLGL